MPVPPRPHLRRALLAVLLAGCSTSGGDATTDPSTRPEVVNVTIAPPPSTALDIGATLTLGASVRTRNGAGAEVVWSSSAPAVASVVDGVVTGVGAGEATIQAQAAADRSRRAELRLTVLPARVLAPVAVAPAAVAVRVGGSAALVASVRTTGGLPATARFVVGDTTIATVGSSDGVTALVRGLRAGETTVTMHAVADPGATATSVVRVSDVGIARIVLDATGDSLRIGTAREFEATLLDSAGAVVGTRTDVAWTVAPPAFVTVAASGPRRARVTGVAGGAATLTASIPVVPGSATRVSASAALVVTTGVHGLQITPDSVALAPGQERTLVARVVADAGTPTDVRWSVDDPGVARVSPAGVVTGVKAGRTNVWAISAHDPRVERTVPVTVQVPTRFMTITPRRDTMHIYLPRDLTIRLTLASPTDQVRLVATSSDTNLATVSLGQADRTTYVANINPRRRGELRVVVSSPDDPLLRDSAMVTLVDPCDDFVRLTIGQTFSGTVGWGSCWNSTEHARFTLTATTFFEVAPTTTFSGIVSPFGSPYGRWDYEWTPTSSSSFYIFAAPGTYWMNVMSRAGTRMPFSVRTAVVAPRCGWAIATHNVSADFPLPARCQPDTPRGGLVGRNAEYNTLLFLTPVLFATDSVTVTATSTDFAPAIEVRDWYEGPTLGATWSDAAGGTARVTVRGKSGARIYPWVVVTSKTPGATGRVTVTITGSERPYFSDAPPDRVPAFSRTVPRR